MVYIYSNSYILSCNMLLWWYNKTLFCDIFCIWSHRHLHPYVYHNKQHEVTEWNKPQLMLKNLLLHTGLNSKMHLTRLLVPVVSSYWIYWVVISRVILYCNTQLIFLLTWYVHFTLCKFVSMMVHLPQPTTNKPIYNTYKYAI